MGRRSREQAQRRQAKRRAEAAAATPVEPPVPAKKPRAERPRDNFRSTDRARAPQHVPQPIPLKLVLGERPASDRSVDDLTWTCGGCGKVNLPRRGLIADYPTLECECGRKCDIDFDFSIANVKINDQDPIIEANVKSQGKKGCVLASTTSNMEVTLQTRTILSGKKFKGKETVINMDKLQEQYEELKNRPGIKKDDKTDNDTVTMLAAIAKHYGVTSAEVDPKVHKIPEYVKVRPTFYDITRVLADGHALTTGIIPGKNFQNLKPGQIYKAPRDEKFIPGQHSRTGHAILLVGAGRRGNTNYYHFLNSWGKRFCVEEGAEGRYGFGMIRASDIRIRPVKFIRYSEEIEYHRRLASTYLG